VTRNTFSSLTEISSTAAELAQLRASADDILRRAWSPEASLKLLDSPRPAFDRALWCTVAELGWPDMLVNDANGGGGGDLRELSVLAEAVGSVAAPVPLATVAAAGWCEDRCADGISLLLPKTAELSSNGVSGVWPLVPYGAVATRLLVCAAGVGGPILGAIDASGPGVTRELLTPLDHNPASRITLQDAPIHVIDDGPDAATRHRDALLRALVAQLAELVGIASAANEAAVEYAKVRVAFGRPIGSFQAVKHRLVDQRSAIEVGRALVNRAAAACEHGDPDREAMGSLAAFWWIDSLRAVPEGATQIFGGIAYTWEHNAHVYLRRAASLAATIGPRPHHRAAVARWLMERAG
jgi:alkylation response protein AidB-like acyl-CoA dehydrogenase